MPPFGAVLLHAYIVRTRMANLPELRVVKLLLWSFVDESHQESGDHSPDNRHEERQAQRTQLRMQRTTILYTSNNS